MKKEHSESATYLCVLKSRGLDSFGLLRAIRLKGRWVFANVPGVTEEREPSAAGTRYTLGLLYPSRMSSLADADIDAQVIAAGATLCHPEVALYLREKYSQERLLAIVNRKRPRGSDEIADVAVRHEIFPGKNTRRAILWARDDADAVSGPKAEERPQWDTKTVFVVCLPERPTRSKKLT
jgi:hypothetical protein